MNMEPRKSVLSADGSLAEQTFESPNVTISYSKKVSDNSYGNQQASIYYEVEVPLGATDDEKLAAIEAGYLLVRNLVDKQLAQQAPQTPMEQRITENLGGEIVSINERKKTIAPRKKVADKRPLWEDVAANPSNWWDNRTSKKNPLGPDFKHKQTGEGLWLSDKPEDIIL